MKKAIISVSDKTNLPILIDFLLSQDYSIISTGGTYKFILNYVKKKIKIELFLFPILLDSQKC